MTDSTRRHDMAQWSASAGIGADGVQVKALSKELIQARSPLLMGKLQGLQSGRALRC